MNGVIALSCFYNNNNLILYFRQYNKCNVRPNNNKKITSKIISINLVRF